MGIFAPLIRIHTVWNWSVEEWASSAVISPQDTSNGEVCWVPKRLSVSDAMRICGQTIQKKADPVYLSIVSVEYESDTQMCDRELTHIEYRDDRRVMPRKEFCEWLLNRTFELRAKLYNRTCAKYYIWIVNAVIEYQICYCILLFTTYFLSQSSITNKKR